MGWRVGILVFEVLGPCSICCLLLGNLRRLPLAMSGGISTLDRMFIVLCFAFF